MVSRWRRIDLSNGRCNVRRVLVDYIVMLSTDDVTMTVSNNVIVVVDVVTRWRMVGRILVNYIMVLPANNMAMTVSNDMIVVVDVVTRLVNRIVTVLPESVACQKCRTCDDGQNV